MLREEHMRCGHICGRGGNYLHLGVREVSHLEEAFQRKLKGRRDWMKFYYAKTKEKALRKEFEHGDHY